MAWKAILLPIIMISMSSVVEIAAGLDLHKRFIIATILWSEGKSIVERFERTKEGLFALKECILGHNCEVVACESTSDYWVQIYDMLNNQVPVIVGNARDIKALSHKKTDKVDSEMIALLALHGMIKPSRIFEPAHREFRKLIRMRHRLVEKRTSVKNQIHEILDSELFLLSSLLTDIFGKSGRIIIQGLINGTELNNILKELPPKVRIRENEFRKILSQGLSADTIFRLSVCMKLIRCFDEQIDVITSEALSYAYHKYDRQMIILKSIPGVGEIGAITLIAEIGDIKDFPSADKLAGWLGLVPNVYQSAGKCHMGSITKRGSIHARWILTQIAHAATRCRDNVLKVFYTRKKAAIGVGKSIIAVARKVVTIIWHLLSYDETYQDPIFAQKRTPSLINLRIPSEISLEELLKVLVDANVYLRKPDPNIS